jgi:hypothetical protein
MTDMLALIETPLWPVDVAVNTLGSTRVDRGTVPRHRR